MRPVLLALACLLAFPALRAQEETKPGKLPEDRTFAKLRGISYFFIDVVTSETRPEDADLRSEIRDAIELEMRRSNIVPKEFVGGNSELATPLLTIEVKFERGLGRYEAVINLTIRDNATIKRNSEAVLAVTYAQTKKAVGSSDGTLAREIKGRSRELAIELIDGLKKLQGK
ncbi:hypothetical protein LBMAG55_10480 [Verrucomicrobiota bacterium]|jgi:hypothetical protein|nr:hypothetical protein LBMAG55_10480 [Verrucomicrobiota bacterium]